MRSHPFQYNDEKDCKNQAPLFLLIGGGITVGMTTLKLIAFLTPCEFDDKVANFLSPLANLANFCVLIWGSVVVFGKNLLWWYWLLAVTTENLPNFGDFLSMHWQSS